jgi:nucleotide-binding universal stress UspA family protein
MVDYRTIMVATDFTPLAGIAQQSGLTLAERVGAKRLHFEHVVQTTVGMPEGDIGPLFESSLESARKNLDDIDAALPDLVVTRHARLGVLGRELARAADEVAADMVVVGSHGYGALRRAVLGSAAGALIRTAHCPVLVVGENRPAHPPFKRILASIDLSLVSEQILKHAFALCAPGGEVTVLSMYEHPLVATNKNEVLPHYVDHEEVKAFGERHAERVRTLINRVPHDVDINIEVISKVPASQVILDVASMLQPDLIVVGTSGHSAWHRMIVGSTSTRVLNEAKQPVLVVPFDVMN